MSPSQVDAIFESCPSKEDIPPHLVDRFKRECILWQSESRPLRLFCAPEFVSGAPEFCQGAPEFLTTKHLEAQGPDRRRSLFILW